MMTLAAPQSRAEMAYHCYKCIPGRTVIALAHKNWERVAERVVAVAGIACTEACHQQCSTEARKTVLQSCVVVGKPGIAAAVDDSWCRTALVVQSTESDGCNPTTRSSFRGGGGLAALKSGKLAKAKASLVRCLCFWWNKVEDDRGRVKIGLSCGCRGGWVLRNRPRSCTEGAVTPAGVLQTTQNAGLDWMNTRGRQPGHGFAPG